MYEHLWYSAKRSIRHMFHVKRKLYADPNGIGLAEMFGGVYH